MPSTTFHTPKAASPSAATPSRWTLGLRRGPSLVLTAGEPAVMGILNLTPDSFSDGGVWFDPKAPANPDKAVARGLEMVAEGATILDLGAESTRPGGGVYGAGARTVPAEEELDRLMPVLEHLRAATDAVLSVDTRKAAVAERALAAGADLVNDVSALGDPDMAGVVAAAGGPVVLMHSRGEISSMQRSIRFTDVVAEVRAELGDALARAAAAGIDPDRVVLDPGIGFGKTAEQNLELLRSLPELAGLGRPVLVGASRKSFLAATTGEPPERRLPGSLAAAGRAADGGAAILRVHDVAETVSFLSTWRALDEAGRREPGRPEGDRHGEIDRGTGRGRGR
jgi:dihydropteroate synthase